MSDSRVTPSPDTFSPGSPAALGFRMPPEWVAHAATHTGWPFDDELWVGHLEGVREEFALMVATIASFEPVVLNVRDDEAEADARRRLAVAAERLYEAAAAELTEHLGVKNFRVPIIMEGGALEINGHGVCLTTRSCLLEPNRNPELSPSEIERYLRDNLGVTQIVWLPAGLEGDHTDGHIDTIVRFADDDTIVCAVEEDVTDPNHATMARNLELLRELRKPDGTPYRLVELPLPAKRMELEGERLPPTYANFYVSNGFVLVPTYNDVNDAAAIKILEPLFPGRQVIGLPAESLITGGGAFHCVTQQRPVGEFVPASWQPTTTDADSTAQANDTEEPK